jgi:hypothetical protein
VGVGVSTGSGGNGAAEEEEAQGVLLDEWEDLCAECGLEFVHVSRASLVGKAPDGGGDKRNEFGERMGIARVMEALQANDWSGGGLAESGDRDEEEENDEMAGMKGGEDPRRDEKEGDGEAEFDFDPESLDFGFDREDFAGLRKAIWSGGERGDEEDEEVGDEDVQKLERMMLKLQAVRDTSAGLPEEQRRRMAARAVGEVMKEL